jgi:glycerol-3-phosphate O-acyltransferase/dihydroxyacetone phosphate acyltransferase
MALRLIRSFARFALWIFFRRVTVHGAENVPRTGPLLVVANHPNVLLDILVLGVSVPRSDLRWIGKNTLLRVRPFGWALRRLGVIPVARPQDKESRISSNRDMLREVTQTIDEGRTVIMFPEGLSHSQIKVKELKHGAAHIALSAAESTGNLSVIPVGLTFFDPGTFRSDVEVHFGKPINISSHRETFHRDHHEAEKALTSDIHERIVSLTRHVENTGLESVVRALSVIYAEPVAKEFDESAEFSRRLRAEQEIIRGVKHFIQTDPQLVQTFSVRLRGHLRKLQRLGLEPNVVSSLLAEKRTGRLISILLLSPVALYGFILNALPYHLTRILTTSYRAQPEMMATLKLSIGTVAFVIHYLLIFALGYAVLDWESAALLSLTLPLSGIFTVYYHEHLLCTVPLWQNIIVPRRRKYLLRRLTRERTQILQDLDKIKEMYLKK